MGRYRYVRLRWRVLFAVVDLLGAAVFGFAQAIRRSVALRQSDSRNDQHDPRVILLVQLDHLGDAILSTAILRPLRRRYPKASIEVLAGASCREVFEAVPEVDRVHVSEANRFARGRLARFAWIPSTLWWGWKLRRLAVDLGIDVRGDFPVALILWLSGARRRVGWGCGGGGFLLTDRAAFIPDRPEIESRWALLAELGIRRRPAPDAQRPRFRPPEWVRHQIAQRLAGLDKAGGGPFLGRPLLPARPRAVLHVGAGTTAKTWPAAHWRELLAQIVAGHGVQVVLVGSSKDRIIAREILGGRPWPDVVDWTGRLSVVELAALLEQADLLVGADSGPAHLAAAVATPVVVLFSGTNNPRQWQPCGEQVTVLRHPIDCSPCNREHCPWVDHPCMTRIRPRRVAAEVYKILSNLPRGRTNRLARSVCGVPRPCRPCSG